MDQRLTVTNICCRQYIDIKFRDLSYTTLTGYCKPKKQILKGLSGYFQSTKLTAIMGPSGAGKSTLLNILSGFQKGLYTGTVEYLKRGNNQNQSSHKNKLCYIQQTDNLHDFFTVHEIMMIASYLKINRSISLKSREMLIDDILETLKLSQIKETRVDQLSGGQKKRLSIALELLDNPSLMFFDEPTTGLDSVASLQCVNALKALAQAGRTIICTIHQPSAVLYEIFDHIYLLVNGHCMYRSSPGDTIDYFVRQGLQCPKYHNPADYILEVVSKEYGNYDVQLIAAAKQVVEASDEAHSMKSSRDMIQEISHNNQTTILTSSPTELMRFWILVKRFMILMHRDHTKVYSQLIIVSLLGILVGKTYEHTSSKGNKVFSNLTYILSTAVYMCYNNLMTAVIKFPLEREIVRKECFNNWYNLRTYYVAMLICGIPLQIIFAFLYSFITYYISNQPPEFSRFSKFLLITILISFICDGIGLGLSGIFNPAHSILIGSFIISAMTVLSGLLIPFRQMNKFMYYISYLNVMRYVVEGMLEAIYDNNNEKLRCSVYYCHFRMPRTILEFYDFNKSMFWFDVAILSGFIVVFHVGAYMLLKKRLSSMY